MKQSRSFTNTILWAFILLNISSLMIFTFSVKYEDGERALNSARTSLSEITKEKSQLVSNVLTGIEHSTENMAGWMSYFLQEDTGSSLESSYFVDERTGVFRRHVPKTDEQASYSAVFFPNSQPLTEEIKQEALKTEKLEPIFAKVRSQEKMVEWVYIATKNNFLRVLPYYNVDVFELGHKQTVDIFYKIADEENNPGKGSTWTEPYVDYLGTGWIISCSHPVYDADGSLFGVVCSDVSIEELKENFFEGFTLGESGKIYVLTDNGSIIYHPDYHIAHETQGALYNQNIFDDETLNPRKEAILRQALEKEGAIFEYTEKGKSKMLAGSRIEGQPWTVIVEIDTNEFLSQNRIEGKVLLQLIFIAVVLAFVLVIILYYEFSIPMRALVDGVREISKGEFGRIKSTNAFLEIVELSEAFNNMNDSLQDYTRKLLRKNNEMNTVLNTIDGELMIIGLDKAIKIANKKANQRMEREGIQERKCYALLEHRNQECEQCVLPAILKSRQPVEKQVVLGNEIYRGTYYPVIEPSGEIKEIVISNQCITKSIVMERELQQIEKMAGIGQFSAAIAHEIKNPLAVISGAAYILGVYNKGDMPAGACSEEIETIEAAVKEAEHVITILLDFSSQETEGGCFIDLKKIVEQILMISRKEIIKRGIETVIEIKAEPFFFKEKPEAVKIILQNLINNAIQAVGENGKVKVTAVKEGSGKILVKVIDDGMGISLKPKSQIFKPFVTTKKESGGTGIGMWITKTLTDGLGGRIEVNEEKEDGTEISVELPIADQADVYPGQEME